MEVNDQAQTPSTLTLATSIQYLLDRTVSWSDCASEQQHLLPCLDMNCDCLAGNQTLNWMSYPGYTNIPYFCSWLILTAAEQFLCSETATAPQHVSILTFVYCFYYETWILKTTEPNMLQNQYVHSSTTWSGIILDKPMIHQLVTTFPEPEDSLQCSQQHAPIY